MMQIPRLPNESARAFKAKTDYLNLGPTRSLEKQLAIYLHRGTAETTPPTQNLRSLKQWSTRFGWVQLAREWDEDQSYQLAKRVADDNRSAYRAELSEFRRIHNQLGRNSVAIIIKLSKRLAAWAETQPETPIHPDDTEKALEVAKVMQTLEKYSEYWSRSLMVDKLLNQLEEGQ